MNKVNEESARVRPRQKGLGGVTELGATYHARPNGEPFGAEPSLKRMCGGRGRVSRLNLSVCLSANTLMC